MAVTNPEVTPQAAPKAPESDKNKELLNKKRAGVQASFLLDGEMPASGKSLDRNRLQEVANKIIEGKSFDTTKITNGSKDERDDHWKNTDYKTFEDQKKAWVDSTNNFLENYKDRLGEKEILEKLGMKAGEADKIYDTFFSSQGEGKGDVGYFAAAAASKLSRDEIEKHSELLLKIGKFYGNGSSEVVKHLIDGIVNVKADFAGFANEAEKQFSQGENMEGIDLIKGVNERSERWVAKQKEAEEKEKERQRIEDEKLKAKEKEPKPEVPSGKENEIRGAMDSLKKLTERLEKEAKDHKFDLSDEKKLDEVKNSEWGKKIMDEYKVNYEKLRQTINEEIKAGNIRYIPQKFEDLKPGDIVDGMKDSSPLDRLYVAQKREKMAGSKEGTEEVYFQAFGPGAEIESNYKITKDKLENGQVQIIEFVNKAQKVEPVIETKVNETVKTGEQISKGPVENGKSEQSLEGNIERFKASGNELVQKFVPILEYMKDMPSIMDAESYLKTVNHAVVTFEEVDKMGKDGKSKKEQLIKFLNFFDTFYYVNKINTDGAVKNYFNGGIQKIENILKEENVEKVGDAKGKEYDDSEMKKIDEKEVNPDMVGKVVEEITPQFNMDGEPLRPAQVIVGAPLKGYG